MKKGVLVIVWNTEKRVQTVSCPLMTEKIEAWQPRPDLTPSCISWTLKHHGLRPCWQRFDWFVGLWYSWSNPFLFSLLQKHIVNQINNAKTRRRKRRPYSVQLVGSTCTDESMAHKWAHNNCCRQCTPTGRGNGMRVATATMVRVEVSGKKAASSPSDPCRRPGIKQQTLL